MGWFLLWYAFNSRNSGEISKGTRKTRPSKGQQDYNIEDEEKDLAWLIKQTDEPKYYWKARVRS